MNESIIGWSSPCPVVVSPGGEGPHFARRAHGTRVSDDRTVPGSGEVAPLLRVDGLCKNYRKGPVRIPVLRGVDLAIEAGEFVAIIGQSGSGKSTLLHLLATLDAPDAGQIVFEDRRIDNLPARQRDRLRNSRFGIVFQFYHLLPELTACENTILPMMISSGMWRYLFGQRPFQQQATELLELVGLADRIRHRPRELSGGEMQRVAIARALVNRPALLLADEPTGNLDGQTGAGILHLLRTLNQEQKLTIVMVTHDMAIAQQADRIVRLVEGRVEGCTAV